MAQAKTLTKEEMTRVLDYINTRRFAHRNRAMMLLTHLAGLRIGEVACLRWSDVMNLDGTVKDEIRLLPDMVILPFARVAEVETLRSHGQSLLRGESAQGHIGAVMVVRPHPLRCKVLHLCQVRPIVL